MWHRRTYRCRYVALCIASPTCRQFAAAASLLSHSPSMNPLNWSTKDDQAIDGHIPAFCQWRVLGGVWQDGRGTLGDQAPQGQATDANRGSAASAVKPEQTAKADPGKKVRHDLLSAALKASSAAAT